MARILFAWELGGGSGHLAPHRPLVEELRREGHDVFFASRDPAAAQAMYPSCRCVAAPAIVGRPITKPIRTYAQILQAAGFDDPEQLGGLVAGWRGLFDDLSPDEVILDHAPGALVALRGRRRRIATVTRGTGFFHPPDVTPLPDLRPWLPAATQQLADDEDRVVQTLNQVLERLGGPKVHSVACLFREVDSAQLTTYPAIDPYRQWPSRHYVGTCSIGGAAPPPWPSGHGPRAFCYLSPSQATNTILRQLVAFGCPSLVALARGSSLRLTLPKSPLLTPVLGHVDLQRVATACDFAVLEGNHFTTVEFLRAGRPILQVPHTLEQTHTALATQAIGCGVVLAPSRVTDATVADVIKRITQGENGRSLFDKLEGRPGVFGPSSRRRE